MAQSLPLQRCLVHLATQLVLVLTLAPVLRRGHCAKDRRPKPDGHCLGAFSTRFSPSASLPIQSQRCWHDADDGAQPGDGDDPLMRPLKRGEVGISFFSNGAREILPDSELELVDRVFQPGDLCKRSVDDVRAGVITNVDVQGRLEHAISGEPVEGWKGMAEVYSTLECELGDYVVYNDWIGQVRSRRRTSGITSSDQFAGGRGTALSCLLAQKERVHASRSSLTRSLWRQQTAWSDYQS
jgi:hypothetical protein